MSIQPLPGDVVAQIKSSAVITSLNGVVVGLLQNSLDAGASKINVAIDYGRGNCSVEDNGQGIAPASFQEGGGLGVLHYTSKYPPRADCHGKHGEFIASLAALSLLSVTSHHRDYRTHNSLTIHNSRVVARNIPALPEQRVLAFLGGTRVVVRDLFGSMPVRVRQRVIEVERSGSSRDFDHLILNIVALLLPWPGEVTVTVQDSYARRTISLRAQGVVDWGRSYRSTAPNIISRTALLLTQASLVEDGDTTSWVPIGATASGLSVRGCVSLRPVATKRVQFISLGVQPLPNDHHSNFLYEEVNHVFDDSSFGVIEEISLGDDGLPAKTEGFIGRELKPKRGIDRWPMFFLQIVLDTGADPVDIDDFLDERRQNTAVITDLLQVMAYEFLKKHHFCPKSVNALERLKRPKPSSPAPRPQPQVSLTAPSNSRSVSRAKQPLSVREARKRSSTPRLNTRIPSPEKRSASPFASWSRVKPSGTEGSGPKDGAAFPQPVQQSPRLAEERCSTPKLSALIPRTENPLFGKSGRLLRKPFDDGDEASASPSSDTPSTEPADTQPSGESGSVRETVVWVDPTTKIKSLIDPRTGFAVRPGSNTGSKPIPRPENLKGAMDVLRINKWKPPQTRDKNTIYQPIEPPVPQVLQVSETLAYDGISGDNHDHCGPNQNMSVTLEGRISKAALQKAKILGQVDQKFILAKVAADQAASSTNCASEGDCLLILIDQHAADERCKVESLLKEYFVPDSTGNGQLVAQIQSLDKAIRFDLSRQDSDLLARFKRHFALWGIFYEILSEQEVAPRLGHCKVTVEIQALPPSILERCRLEPKILIDLLRKEIWKLDGMSNRLGGGSSSVNARRDDNWVTRFHDCPEGILDLIHSRACRSAIMFNDPMTLDQCSDLVQQLAACAFPFQCAHGRPSMVPLVHLSGSDAFRSFSLEPDDGQGEDLLGDLKRWRRRMKAGD